MLACEGLTLRYKDGHNENVVLENVDLTVENGRNVVLLGPSGSGKSSLLYLLSGLKKPSAGRVLVDGADVSVLSANRYADLRRRRFGYIFQMHFLIPYLTVLENVLTGAPRMNGEARGKAMTLLKELDIDRYAKKRIHELSGGERQRVAVARALVSDPEVIFADEPTASLDHKNAVEIIRLLKEYKSDSTLLMATHDTSILAGDETVWHIENRKVVGEGAGAPSADGRVSR